MSERASGFLQNNEREPKPRTRGLTEIRGPYLQPKPEVGIQFGASGASAIETLEAEARATSARRSSSPAATSRPGASMVMIESEGITEQVREWRPAVVSRIA